MTLECVSERAFAHKHGDEAVLPKPQDPVYERGTPTVRDFPPHHPVVERAKADLVSLEREIEQRKDSMYRLRDQLDEESAVLTKLQSNADYLTTFLEPKP